MFIHHMDAPPGFCFTITDGITSVSLQFTICGFTGYNSYKEAGLDVDRLINYIESILPNNSSIIWRRRPEICWDGGSVSFYCRFATSPPLPKGFEKLTIQEGEMFRRKEDMIL